MAAARGQWDLKRRLPMDYRNLCDSTATRRFWSQTRKPCVVPLGHQLPLLGTNAVSQRLAAACTAVLNLQSP
jgi:hypothetical protein